MRHNLNFDSLRDKPDGEKRTAIFGGIKQSLLMTALMVDMLGPTRCAKATAGENAIIRGAANDLAFDEVKSYLRSNKAARFMGGQKWAVPDDNPLLTQTTGAMVSFFHDSMKDIDLGWQVLFDLVDLRNSDQDHFELMNSNFGIVWTQQKPGGRTKPLREISEAKTNVPYLTYVTGYSLLDDWIRFNKFYLVSDMLAEVESKYWDLQATLYYGLFTALGAGINIAFSVDDATTFNNAAASILRANEAKGYALGSNAQLDIAVNPEKVGRVLAMLDAKRGSPMVAFGTQKQPISFQVRNVIVTTKVSAADTGYYLVLPGRKLKRGTWMDLSVESKREPSVSAEDWFAKAQFNAIIGDSDQVRRVLYT